MTDLRRSDAQNRKLRAILEDVSRSRPEGRCHTPETWKVLFMAALDHDSRFADMQMIEGLEGRPPVALGYHSSLLTVQQMADLITLITEYGDRHGVRWGGGDHDMAADPLMRMKGRTERIPTRIEARDRPFMRDPLMIGGVTNRTP